MRRGNLLTVLILIALVAGGLFGQFVLFDVDNPIGSDHWTYEVGNLIFVRPLKLLIIPLVFVSVVAGVTSIGDPSKLGLVGGSTIFYYLATMLIAVTLGAILVTSVQPGNLDDDVRARLTQNADAQYQTVASRIEDARAEEKDSLGGAWLNILHQMIPTNIVNEAAKGSTLGIIMAALIFGLAIAVGGPTTAPLVTFFEAAFDALMRLVGWIIWVAPVGTFFLIAWTVGKIGIAELVGPLALYIGTVVGGLLIHGLIVLPLILLIAGRTNPWQYLWRMRRALLTAFATDSSSATLPVTIDTAENEGGCSKRAANFVLPLGSTVNMDGTALYEAVAVVFLFQFFDFQLGFAELVIVVITATLAAIGAAGIPGAGVVTMVIVIGAVSTSLGLPADKALMLESTGIGIIIGVDRVVDMCRTTVNVWGDAVGAKIITRLVPDQPEPAVE